jgi:peptidyl-prolyl cis-trans isomerase SurA
VQPTVLALGQVLVRVPEGADSQTVAGLRKKTEEVLAQLRGGADFASVAAASSNGPEALQGGNMGTRPIDGWPELFLQAVANLAPGQPSDIVQSGNGFHILTVLGRQSGGAVPASASVQNLQEGAAPAGPMNVTQTHARHILIKTSTVMSDEQARQRLEHLRQRIVRGNESFTDLARQNSQDASAPQGGDLGWLSPGNTVPPFEQAMAALQPQEISQPVQSPFGWHLIQVEARREQDVADEYQRMQARQILFERRAQPAVDDWLQQLRERAYVDNRLEKLDRLQSTNQ